MRQRWLLAVMLQVAPTAVSDDASVARTESFDVAPEWESFRSRLLPASLPHVRQDFGYRQTQLAGGDGAGEIGGTVQRSTTPARFSMSIAERTFDDELSASGTFAVPQAGGGSGLMFGWFNENSKGWRTSNSLGFRLDGNGGKYWVFYEYGTRNRRTGGGGAFEGERYQTTSTPPFLADGTPHQWSLRYKPDDQGTGLITFQIDDRTYRVDVPAKHREDGATFNRFGIWNVETGGDTLDAYFDDLTVDGQSLAFDQDPNWIGDGNNAEFEERIIRPHHDYGFSKTSHAGGQPGEIGGVIFRDEQPSYYAARTNRLSLEHPLRASGTIVLNSAGADSGFLLGWFDCESKRSKTTPEYEQPQPNYLGVMIEGPSRIGHVFRAAYSTSEGNRHAPIADVESDVLRPVILPDGTVHCWSIAYEPMVADRGQITVTFDDTKHTLDLRPGDRHDGAVFDRFGLFNIQAGGHHTEVYIDDLTFTVQ